MSDPTVPTRTRNSLRRVARHLRRQWAGFLALFLVATTGGAYALAGSNTVFSDDIVNGHVRTADIDADAVKAAEVAAGVIKSNHVLDESLTGTDIVESTLETVPVSAQGGTGRYGFDGQCDPDGLTFIDCSSVQVTLARPGRLLITGTVTALATAEWAIGACRLEVDGEPILASWIGFDWDAEDRDTQSEVPGSTTAVSHVYPAGTHVAGIECQERHTGGGDGRIAFPWHG